MVAILLIENAKRLGTLCGVAALAVDLGGRAPFNGQAAR